MQGTFVVPAPTASWCWKVGCQLAQRNTGGSCRSNDSVATYPWFQGVSSECVLSICSTSTLACSSLRRFQSWNGHYSAAPTMSNLPLQFVRATQTGVYHLARVFGFQQFNYSITTKRWVPAVAGLAADQIVSLLQDAAIRRCATKLVVPHTLAGWEAEWAAAIADLHREYFEEYQRWCNKLQLPDPETQQQGLQQQPPRHRNLTAEDAPLLLLELSLQFLVYTEAANLRHTPHLLFLIYYIMRGSQAFQQALNLYTHRGPAGAAPPNSSSTRLPYTHWQYWLHCSADNFGENKPSGYDVTSLRMNLLQQMYDADPAVFHYKDPEAPKLDLKQTRPLQDAVNGIVAVSLNTADNPQLQELTRDVLQELQDIFKYGSQQVFLNNVVQPLFYFLAEQLDLAGHQGSEEAALRIAYCDVDEACCSPTGVVKMLDALKQEGWERMALIGSQHSRDLWNALLQVMQPLTPQEVAALQRAPEAGRIKALLDKVRRRTAEVQGGVKDRYPRDSHRVAVLENLKILLQRGDGKDLEDATQATEAKRHEALKHVTAKCLPALTNESDAISTVYQRAKYGAAWWSNNLFRAKTFVEARTVAAPFVAFWRIYNFHAVLFTAMMAVSFVLNKTGGIWRRTAPVDGWQLMAGLALSTVMDSLMRVLRDTACLLLYSYNRPVVRKQVTLGEEEKPEVYKIDPFPSGTWLRALRKTIKLVVWLVWTAFLALCVLPVLVDMSQPLSNLPGLTRVLHADHWWLLPAAIHAVVLWGGSACRQKSGYTISWTGMMHEWYETINQWRRRHSPVADRNSSRWQKFAGHADCASDSRIDALFYPSKYLQTDKTRSWTNRISWVVVILVKIAFEFFLILQPLMLVILELQRVDESRDIAKDDFASDRKEVNKVFNYIVTWLQIVAVSVPAALISLSDTGLLFSVAGGVLSGVVGFYRGVGSIKTWPEMINNFNIILDNYKKHCVSRSALMLHLHGSKDNVAVALQQMSMSALSAGWNAMVYDLRQRDLLSNKELACIAFEQLVLDEGTQQELKDMGLTDVLPARCFIAGAVPELASAAAGSDHQLYVAGVCWQWFGWLLYKCDFIQKTDMDGLLRFKLPHPAPSREQANRRQELLKETLRFIKLLSTSSSSPSNLKAAVAAASAPDVFASGSAAAAAVAGTAHTGMLHAVPADDAQQLKGYQELLTSLEFLLKCLRQEVKEMAILLHSGPYSPCSSADIDRIGAVLNRLERRWAPWLQPQAIADQMHSTQQHQRAKDLKERAFGERDNWARTMRKATMKDVEGGRVVLLEGLLNVGQSVPAAAQVGELISVLMHRWL
eukprot:GHUV01004631.1.p1 GENE.GHUV01004631.1~~GHUV01004631.1.p1  ORF type:complete len:1313 (+),score=319.45 GHUV01004631.1:85-4023(+)